MRVWGFHPLRPGFPARSHFRLAGVWRGPITPAPPRRRRFGLLRFRSPLLAKSLLFSSPAGTKMFQFPAFASLDTGPSARWVDPFGNPGIEGYLHLPRTYRSLSRPSSPLRAKASPMRSCLLSSVTLITLSYPFLPCVQAARRILLSLCCYSFVSLNMSKTLGASAPFAETDRTTGLSVRPCGRTGAPSPGRASSSFTAAAPPVENKGVEPLTPCLQSRCSSLLS